MAVPTAEPKTRTDTVAFGPLRIQYDDRVLVPRPWTLMQSAWAADLAAMMPDGPIAELACGVGHIGLAAAAMADRDIVLVDAAPVACTYARLNATFNGLGARVEVRQARFEDAFAPDELFGLILADPPYIPSAEIQQFSEDPVVAIDGGAAGTELLVRCIEVFERHLHTDGVALLQLRGARQAAEIADHVTRRRLQQVEIREINAERAVIALQRA